MINLRFWLVLLPVLLIIWFFFKNLGHPPVWSAEELKQIKSLSIIGLKPPPPDPTNLVSDNRQAAKLGRELFFDRKLSNTGTIACASCHMPTQHFRDLPRSNFMALRKFENKFRGV